MHLTYVVSHEVTWCMVVWLYTERAETAAVSCGTSHANAVSTPLRKIFKNALYTASHSCTITCESNESARERKIALQKSDQQQHKQETCDGGRSQRGVENMAGLTVWGKGNVLRLALNESRVSFGEEAEGHSM